MIIDYEGGIDNIFIQNTNANTFLLMSSFDGVSVEYKGFNFTLKVELKMEDDDEDELISMRDYVSYTHEININNRDIGNKTEGVIEINFMRVQDLDIEEDLTERDILKRISKVIRHNLDDIIDNYDLKGMSKRDKKVIENRSYVKNIITEVK